MIQLSTIKVGKCCTIILTLAQLKIAIALMTIQIDVDNEFMISRETTFLNIVHGAQICNDLS